MLSKEHQDKAIAEIVEWLTLLDKMKRDNNPNSLKGSSAEGLILAHGKPYYMAEHSFSGRRGAGKQCYCNAFNEIHRDPSLTYVEGYCHIGLLSIEHAWCIDANGAVIDPTLDPEGATLAPRGYFGIPFNKDYVRRVALKTKVFGILSYTNRPLQAGKVPPEQFLAGK